MLKLPLLHSVRSWPRWKRVVAAMLISPTLLATLATLAFYSNLHRRASAMTTASMASFPALESTRRLLILAPHCDDEVLGAGGLIAEARLRRIPVTVAFFTNGDAFPAACALSSKKVNLSSADYIRFGELRQKEALTALARLGVPAEQVHFLSYPDRGLKTLWETSWCAEHPYRSSYTASDHSPFTRTYTPRASYRGQSVRQDMVRLLEEVRPTDVFVTHPADDHADHSAAAAFTQAGLEEVREKGKIAPPQLHYYIVHRGDWPLPQGFNPDKPLVPPAGLTHADTSWATLPLTPAAVRAKREALNCYRTQMEICGRQLRSFVRANEIFGKLPDTQLAPARVGIARDGIQDDVVRFANPSTDLTQIAVLQKDNELEVRLRLRGAVNPGVRYALRLQSDQGIALTTNLKAPRLPNSRLTELVSRIPLKELENPSGTLPRVVWVSAETGITNRYIVDQTGYREFHLNLKSESTEE